LGVDGLGEDDVAGGACETGLACALELDVVCFGYLEQVLAFLGCHFLPRTVSSNKCEFNPCAEHFPSYAETSCEHVFNDS
jgi:hypothetical protein